MSSAAARRLSKEGFREGASGSHKRPFVRLSNDRRREGISRQRWPCCAGLRHNTGRLIVLGSRDLDQSVLNVSAYALVAHPVGRQHGVSSPGHEMISTT